MQCGKESLLRWFVPTDQHMPDQPTERGLAAALAAVFHGMHLHERVHNFFSGPGVLRTATKQLRGVKRLVQFV